MCIFGFETISASIVVELIMTNISEELSVVEGKRTEQATLILTFFADVVCPR